MAPLVSIIMPVYNDPVRVRECIASIQAQTYQNWELIVVDDESTDETPQVIKELMSSDPRIQLVRVPHFGNDETRCSGFPLINGQYVTFIDSDDTWPTTSLEVRVNFLESHPDFLGVSGAYDAGSVRINTSDKSFDMVHFLKWEITRANWAYMFRSEIIKDFKLEPFGLYQDAIVTYELIKKYPLQVCYIDDLIYNYRVQANSLSFNPSKQLDRLKATLKTIQYFVNDTTVYREHKSLILDYAKKLLELEIHNAKATGKTKGLKHALRFYMKENYPHKKYLLHKAIWPGVIQNIMRQAKVLQQI